MVIAVILTVVALLAFRGLMVMVLWNWLMPTILHLPEISFFEGIGLFLLASFLMGSIVDKNALPKANKVEKK